MTKFLLMNFQNRFAVRLITATELDLVTFGENDNNKKLQFGASPRVVHKRTTWQKMPIWERKQTSSVILRQVARLR